VALRHERPFWLGYCEFNVSTNTNRIEKLKYAYRNPVSRGSVGKLEDWHCSSYRHDQMGLEGTAHGRELMGIRL
jgi:hypothetical protein